MKLHESRDVIIELILISTADLQRKYHATKVCTICLLFVITKANGRHSPRPTLSYATVIQSHKQSPHNIIVTTLSLTYIRLTYT